MSQTGHCHGLNTIARARGARRPEIALNLALEAV